MKKSRSFTIALLLFLVSACNLSAEEPAVEDFVTIEQSVDYVLLPEGEFVTVGWDESDNATRILLVDDTEVCYIIPNTDPVIADCVEKALVHDMEEDSATALAIPGEVGLILLRRSGEDIFYFSGNEVP